MNVLMGGGRCGGSETKRLRNKFKEIQWRTEGRRRKEGWKKRERRVTVKVYYCIRLPKKEKRKIFALT